MRWIQLRRGAQAAGFAIAVLFASGVNADPYSGGGGYNPGSNTASSASSNAASGARQSIIRSARDDARRRARHKKSKRRH
jgi:hypothetical protein